MNQQNALPTVGKLPQAIGGVLFAAFFLAGDVLRGRLAKGPLPPPGASAAEVANYFVQSRTAALAVSTVQLLSALALFVFAGCVVHVVRQTRSEGGMLPGLTLIGGVAAAVALLVCALLGFVLAAVAPGGNLGLIDTLRTANFLTGGTLHIASLGIFVGAASLVARRTKALPGWIVWLDIILAVPAILSLASLVLYPANAFILLGRMLGFIWCIAAGIALALGTRRASAQKGNRHVLA